jgi:hypothetical protein
VYPGLESRLTWFPYLRNEAWQKNGATPEVTFSEEESAATKATTPRSVLVSSPGEDGFCSSRNSTYKNAAKTTSVCFGEQIIGTEVTIPKIILGSSPGEDSLCSSETKHSKKIVQ